TKGIIVVFFRVRICNLHSDAGSLSKKMFRNYLKIALRSIRKHAIYSFINIFGLSVRIAFSIVISLWVSHEVSFDRSHTNLDQLYQVWINATFDGKVNSWTSVPLPTAEALKE